MKATDLARDVAGVTGAISIAGGAALIYIPAGLIVAGLMLVAAAWLSARRS